MTFVLPVGWVELVAIVGEAEELRGVPDQDRLLSLRREAQPGELGEPAVEGDEGVVAAEEGLAVQALADLALDLGGEVLRRPAGQLDEDVRLVEGVGEGLLVAGEAE